MRLSVKFYDFTTIIPCISQRDINFVYQNVKVRYFNKAIIMQYNLVLIPVYLAMVWALYHEMRLRHKMGSILLAFICVVFCIRFFLLGLTFDGVQLSPVLDLLNQFTMLSIIPCTYMYLCDQCGTQWYNVTARVMWLLMFFVFVPESTQEKVLPISIADIVCTTQCLLVAWRMCVLYKRIQRYGLKFSARIKNYFVWMVFFLVLGIISFLNGEFIQTNERTHWFFFIAYSLVATWGFALVPSAFSVGPIVTEDTEEPVHLDRFLENNAQMVDRLHVLFEEDKVFLRQGITIDDVADMVGTNRTYVTRLMRQEFNQTFNEYVNNARIVYAKQLLLNGTHSIEDIAHHSGFSNGSAFCRKFKSITNMTPTQWKNDA